MKKHFLVVGIMFLFVFSSVPVTFGYNVRTSNVEPIVESVNFDSYHISEITRNTPHTSLDNISNTDIVESNRIDTLKETLEPLDGPMDSPWPMYCYDTRHTGRSPYSTADNKGYEKWRLRLHGLVWGSPILDKDGVIYIGAWDFYAIYPNGTLKWQFDGYIRAMSSPAIDENGIIYIGSIWAHPNYLYAIYSSNGTLKWKFKTDNHIFSSPAIGEDGSIYFGSEDEKIYALYPNGTLKWKYKTGHVVLSSPAIGEDGTVYCGSHDTYLYAFHPNNGTVKWRYKTGHWVRVSPCIADDGTIYIVSLDNYLHAINPNGTRKWRTDVGAGTSPTIGQDGTIYCGYSKLYAINPTDGSVKWTFDVQGKIRGGTPCNSIDGTIYLGNYDGSDIVAVNPDGTEKWRKSIGGDVESAPCIGEDGTVYIGDGYAGYLHAFGYPGPNPFAPDINGPTTGKPDTSYTYTFTSIDPDEDEVSYFIDWDEGNITDWTDYQPSGEPYSESHIWTTYGAYTIRAKARDTDGYESDWGELTVTMPRDKATNNMLFWRLLERFPLLREVLLRLIPR